MTGKLASIACARSDLIVFLCGLIHPGSCTGSPRFVMIFLFISLFGIRSENADGFSEF